MSDALPMKILKGQTVDCYDNQTVIFLPSFAKAWEIYESIMTRDGDPFKEAREMGLAVTMDKELMASYWKTSPVNKTEEQKQKALAQMKEVRLSEMNSVWRQITHGPGDGFISMIEAVSHALIELAVQIDPSLRPVNDWKRQEIGPVFDAGLIASEDERPCFEQSMPTDIFRKGDGQAYRLLINTDTCAGHSDSENCIATMSLVRCLIHFGEVELWIQQGWVGSNPKSGATLFPIHRGQEITPALTWFWLASPYRDASFSRIVNMGLGRRNSGVSEQPQMEHDIYIANAIGAMPMLTGVPQMAQKLNTGKPLSESEHKRLEALAAWLAQTIRSTVYTDEHIAQLPEVGAVE